MAKQYLLGIDIGTSGTKTVLFDAQGAIIAEASATYPLYQPQATWAEQDADDWWNACVATIRGVLDAAKIDPKQVAGIGLSGQMHGLVMLDEAGKPLRRSIIWCDQRTTLECQQLTELVGKDELLDITCNPALTGFTSTKILWVKNNEPQIFAKCHKILLPKDYIRYKLTGEFASEVSDASGMQLLDVKGRCWSRAMLDKLELSATQLGKMYESCEATGCVSKTAAEATGLAVGTIVAGGAGDQAAAAVGNGIIAEGLVSSTIGSSGVVFAHTDKPVFDKLGRLHTFCHAVPNAWHVMGVTQGAGLSMKWFKDNFYAEAGENAYSVINEQIATVAPLSDGLIYLPYLMGERCPHLDSDARGVFFGLTALHTKAHFARAVMEGVSYSLNDCLSLIKACGITPSQIMLSGGGARSAIWRQMLSDVFAVDTVTPSSAEAGCLGVAILAAVAGGVYASVQQATEQMRRAIISSANSPCPKLAKRYARGYAAYRGLYQSLANNFKEIKNI